MDSPYPHTIYRTARPRAPPAEVAPPATCFADTARPASQEAAMVLEEALDDARQGELAATSWRTAKKK